MHEVTGAPGHLAAPGVSLDSHETNVRPINKKGRLRLHGAISAYLRSHGEKTPVV
jgi:hypothetical protein